MGNEREEEERKEARRETRDEPTTTVYVRDTISFLILTFRLLFLPLFLFPILPSYSSSSSFFFTSYLDERTATLESLTTEIVGQQHIIKIAWVETDTNLWCGEPPKIALQYVGQRHLVYSS